MKAGRDNVVVTATRYEDRISVCARFSEHVHTDPGVHPVACKTGIRAHSYR